jgi:CDP-diglyceride synthetase
MIPSIASAPPKTSGVLLLLVSLLAGSFGQYGGYQEQCGPYAGWMGLGLGFALSLVLIALLGRVVESWHRRQGGYR